MKTFINQIKKACANYYYVNIVRVMQIKGDFENTRVAIVSIREYKDTKRYYTIYYRYNGMKKIDNTGHFESIYNLNGDCAYNGFIEAYDEFAKFAN